jgi:hypothetical protein
MDKVEEIRSLTYLLIDTAVGFVILAVLVLIFILFYLVVFKRKGLKNLKMANQFYTLVSEISLCESAAELEEVYAQSYVQEMQQAYFRKNRRRGFVLKALIQFHKSIHGVAADNIKWLYEKLDFKKDSLKQLASRRWHKKAAAIQELAQMGQQDCITKLYRYTNHTNYYIRSEAQVAVVKLTGFDGLRFLNVINQPITQWQQLCLLQQLAHHSNIQDEKLNVWLKSSNDTVVELALKLVQAYHIHSTHDSLVNCLKHDSVLIRTEAIMVLSELAQANTLSILKAHYVYGTLGEKIAILKAIGANGAAEDLSFLEKQVACEDPQLHNEAVKIIREIQPEWGNRISKPIIHHQESAIVL